MDQSAPREEALFAAALALPAAERLGYLERACGGDAELRRRVQVLLRSQEAIGGFLETPPASDLADVARAAAAMTPEPGAGTKIGRYKLLEKIGEGGCGIVFLAAQEEPIHRRVALKIVKLGMDTREVLARFAAERQALALMDHPNIAQVLDAGATETGRPYFVMELVRGVKITAYCDQYNLSTVARLNLFIPVCHAVQHAHQKGIIHRDLKPSNILVTLQDGAPVPKVIDFGIAKATQGRLTDQTLYTAFEQFIGTPAYMSPEQAQLTSQDVDTRSDIYSLGVLLYELLTGRTPFDTRELLRAGLDEMRRQIREVEPPKPSTRLSTLDGPTLHTAAERRATEAPKLISLVRGDLDWIVMRCLEKNRTRRYESATAIASDIDHHFRNEPVAARPPSTAYTLQKFLRRHTLGIGAAAAILVVLLAGLIVSTWQSVRATRAENLADTRLQSELAARREAERQRQIAFDRLAAEKAARGEAERQKMLAEHERDHAKNAEKLAADRLQAELDARREAERQSQVAEQQRALAEQERNHARDAEKTAQAEAARNAEAARLMQNMLRGAGPHVALVQDAQSLNRILDQAARRLLTAPESPAKTELRDALTAVYYDLGDYATSTALGGRWASRDHPPLALALDQLGVALMHDRQLGDAERVLREAVTVDCLVSVTDAGHPGSPLVLADLNAVLKLAGKPAQTAVPPGPDTPATKNTPPEPPPPTRSQ